MDKKFTLIWIIISIITAVILWIPYAIYITGYAEKICFGVIFILLQLVVPFALSIMLRLGINHESNSNNNNNSHNNKNNNKKNK